MANPTTNYGFVLPTPTDLVTDLPADFDVALQGVDTRLKALNPSTTLGDVEYASATANTNTRLGIGTTGQVLTVSGGVPAWATPAGGGGMTLISTTNLSSTSVTLSSIPSTYNTLYVIVRGAVFGTSGSVMQFLPNSLTTNYGMISRNDNGTAEIISMANMAIQNRSQTQQTGGNNVYVLEIDNYSSASYFKAFNYYGYHEKGGSNAPLAFTVSGGIRTTSAISSLVIQTENAYTFSAGQVLLYGVK